jgi:hypothetical protein
MTAFRRVETSPFFSRAYGSFSPDQAEFARFHLGESNPQIVLDPMAGHASLPCALAHEGSNVIAGDLNPAPLLLATLRDPAVVRQRRSLSNWMSRVLSQLSSSRTSTRRDHCAEWLTPHVRNDLAEFAEITRVSEIESPFDTSNDLWHSSMRRQFAAALPILAARSVVCYTPSDNDTWPKRGGLSPPISFRDALQDSLERWFSWADAAAGGLRRGGMIRFYRGNVTQGMFGGTERPDAIVTSPPYANRLDYTQMWSPEIHVSAALWGKGELSLKKEMMGTTVVKGNERNGDAEGYLPADIKRALREIKVYDTPYSDSYYYPFFRNYVLSLRDGLDAMAGHLLPRGIILVFVRDTARKDTLVPIGKMVQLVLKRLGFRPTSKESVRELTVRRHIGLRQKNVGRGLYGASQREWFLAFRKES